MPSWHTAHFAYTGVNMLHPRLNLSQLQHICPVLLLVPKSFHTSVPASVPASVYCQMQPHANKFRLVRSHVNPDPDFHTSPPSPHKHATQCCAVSADINIVCVCRYRKSRLLLLLHSALLARAMAARALPHAAGLHPQGLAPGPRRAARAQSAAERRRRSC